MLRKASICHNALIRFFSRHSDALDNVLNLQKREEKEDVEELRVSLWAKGEQNTLRTFPITSILHTLSEEHGGGGWWAYYMKIWIWQRHKDADDNDDVRTQVSITGIHSAR